MDAAPASRTRRVTFAILYAVAGLVSLPASWLAFDSGHTDTGGLLVLVAAVSVFFAVLLLRGKGGFLLQPLSRSIRPWQLWTVLVVSVVNVVLRLLLPAPYEQPWITWYWLAFGAAAAGLLIHNAVVTRRRPRDPPA